jgi:hypothetical protein
LTCGKRGDVFEYLNGVARGEKTSSKSTFLASKPTKYRQKQKGEVQRRLMEGVGTLFFPLEGAG